MIQIAPQNPAGADPSKVMVVDTEEGSRYTIGYGFGFEVQRLPGATAVASTPGTSGTGTANPSGTTIGASPRGTIGLDKCARAYAWLKGRDYVRPDDVQAVAHDVLRHRLLLSYDAQAEGTKADQVIKKIIELVAVA